MKAKYDADASRECTYSVLFASGAEIIGADPERKQFPVVLHVNIRIRLQLR